jgi:hypothetical protein
MLLAIAAASAAGAAQAAVDDDALKQSIDATRPLQVDLDPAGSLVPNDLSLDLDFNGGGLKSIWAPAPVGWSETDDGVRAFPWVENVTVPGPPPVTVPSHKGWYVIGKQKNTAGDGWRVWIARFNTGGMQDASFGTDGWIYGNAQDDIVDAVIVGHKAYILANIFSGTAAPPATRVSCKDLGTPTGSDCFPALAGVQTWGATAAGPRTAAYAQRLAYDSRFGLFVAARVINNNRGQEVGIARISADDGSLVTEFRDAGYNIGLPTWADPTQAEVSVNALVVTPAGYPGGTRLYVAGQMKRTANDHDGFILGLGPTNGATSTHWNWNDQSYWYEADNTDYRKDAISALTVLRNGKIAFAGWSESDQADTRPMMMGRVASDGTYDASFCAGNANRGARGCLVDPPRTYSGPILIGSYKPESTPVAIAERAMNRDLVVAQRFVDNGGTTLFPDDHRVRTLVQQFAASGNHAHAARTIDYAALGAGDQWGRPFGMYLGPAGLEPEVLAVVGTRHWSGVDYDATLSVLVATDTIFANPFGTANGD